MTDDIKQLHYQLAITKQQRNQALDELVAVTARVVFLEEQVRGLTAKAEVPHGNE